MEQISTMFIIFGVIVAFVVLAIILSYQKRRKKYDLMKISLRDIDRMTGHEFEDYLFVLFAGLGYDHTYQTKKSRDFGADLIFEDSHGFKTVVQAKCLSDSLGLKAVQEVYTAKVYYGADKALVLTSTDDISEPCLKLASATDVKIIARVQLEEIIKQFKKGNHEQAQDIIEEPFEKIAYKPEESFVTPEKHRGVIRSGDYFYKRTSRIKKSG
ncbi:restriction endonuclease [Halalkalibacterium ligniniphilum]|uniref:restriction endonuclease n=1 Tax=Halalkalibacterium ligniniphilum TaxID=1134413 RepID=UPI00034A2EBC|nr:restriction endonuclease [Halalkalibacterium ligniniphilum]